MSKPKGSSVNRVPKTQRLVAPSGNEPFSEWSREEKDEYARKRMEEMKLRNEKYKQRHAEVEKDRKKAEEKHSSVTSVLSATKDKVDINEELPKPVEVVAKPKVKEREWDRGKSLVNLEHWNNRKPDNRPDNYYQSNWKAFGDKRTAKKDDNWRNQNSSRFKDSGRTYGNKFAETRQSTNNYRNDSSFSKPRGRGYRSGNYNYAPNSKMQDARKQPLVGTGDTHSQGPSDSEMDQVKHSGRYENDRMWRDGGMNEVRHRQIRVEKWVKSINNECLKDDGFTSTKTEKARYQNKSYDGYNNKEEYLEKARKISESDRMPKSDWKAKSYSKKQTSADYSGRYENQGYKKQSERKPNAWRKPNIPTRDQFLDNLTKVPDPTPEFEISEDMIVKIEGHTVKRTFINYHENTERNEVQENTTEDESIPVDHNIQQGSDKSDQWEKTGRWGDCNYDDDDSPKSVGAQDFVANPELNSNLHSPDPVYCDAYKSDEQYVLKNENEYVEFGSKETSDCDYYQEDELLQATNRNHEDNDYYQVYQKIPSEDPSNFENEEGIPVENNTSNDPENCDYRTNKLLQSCLESKNTETETIIKESGEDAQKQNSTSIEVNKSVNPSYPADDLSEIDNDSFSSDM